MAETTLPSLLLNNSEIRDNTRKSLEQISGISAEIKEKFGGLLQVRKNLVQDFFNGLLSSSKKLVTGESNAQSLRKQEAQVEREERTNELLQEIVGLLGGQNTSLEKLKKSIGKTKEGGFLNTILDFAAANPIITALGVPWLFKQLVAFKTWFAGSALGKKILTDGFITTAVNSIRSGFAKLFKFGGITASIVSLYNDAFLGWFRAGDMKVEKISAMLGSMFAGEPKGGLMNALQNAGKWAFIGAGIGAASPVPFGWVIGAIGGAIAGALAGWVGSDFYTNFFDKYFNGKWLDNLIADVNIMKPVEDFFKDLGNTFSEIIQSINEKLDYFREKFGLKTTRDDVEDRQRDMGFRVGNPDEYMDIFKGPDKSVVDNILTAKPGQDLSQTQTLLNYGAGKIGLTTNEGPQNRENPTIQHQYLTTDDAFQKVDAGIMKMSNIQNPNSQEYFKNATLDSVKSFEDYKQFPYGDRKGPAIGFGFNYLPKDMSILDSPILQKTGIEQRKTTPNDVMTVEKANKWINYLIDERNEYLTNNYKFYERLPNAVKSTLINMSYQMGDSGLSKNFKGMFDVLSQYLTAKDKDERIEILQQASEFIAGDNRVQVRGFNEKNQPRAQTLAHQMSMAERGNLIFGDKGKGFPIAVDKFSKVFVEPKAKGFIAKKPEVILTGEYDGANENPEVTIQMNALENRILATTNRLFKMKQDMEKKDNKILTSTFENKLERTVENTRISEERVQMKDMLQQKAMQIQMPVMNSVVDNKVINNTSSPILVQKTSKNEHNPFRMS